MKRLLPILLTVMLCSCAPAEPAGTKGTIPSSPPQTTAAAVVIPPSTASQSPALPSTQAPEAVQVLLSHMTTEEKVGQLFLARCPDRDALSHIEAYHLGGYILFARDFDGETPDTVRQTIRSYQSASSIPMLIAVDEEGGTVTRISRFPAFRSAPFPSPRKLYGSGGLPLLLSTEAEKCKLLRSLGINVNVAPVCDVTTDPNAFMYPRSLGQSPEITGQFASSVIQIMHANGIGGILKHFPGYGNNTDTHTAIAVDNRTLAQLESCDLIPFQTAIRSGAQAILVSHVYIHAIDPDMPATLSPAVHAYLRMEMGFDGVIVTDDLVMKAITDVYGVGESAVLAVLAGNDLLCATDYPEQYTAVLQAVNSGRISPELLDAAVSRILRWKMELQLL